MSAGPFFVAQRGKYERHDYCALPQLPADLTLVQRMAILKVFGVWRSW